MEVNLSDKHNNILPYFAIDQLFMQQSHSNYITKIGILLYPTCYGYALPYI